MINTNTIKIMFKNPFKNLTPPALTRTLVRIAACLIAAGIAIRVDPPWLAGWLPTISPFNALLATAAGAGALFMLSSLVLVAISVFWPRAFCRWLCPTGTCQDAIACFRKPRTWITRMPRLGLWLVLLALGAALTGYPLFGWLDPLVLFTASAGAATVSHPEKWAWAAAGLPLLMLLALLAPGLWCGRLCPLGALQDLLRLPARRWAHTRPTTTPEQAKIGRRAFIGLGLGAGYRVALDPARAATPVTIIRPPSHLSSTRFTSLCVRCGACVRVCPTEIIRFGGTHDGWHGILAPELCFSNNFCAPECVACGQACPSGAIPQFTLQTKYQRPLGVAAVQVRDCLLSDNKECGACVVACPYNALDLAWDPQELSSRILIDNHTCTGCGCCEYVCPVTPKAIHVGPLSKAESGSEPLRGSQNQATFSAICRV